MLLVCTGGGSGGKSKFSTIPSLSTKLHEVHYSNVQSTQSELLCLFLKTLEFLVLDSFLELAFLRFIF